MTCYTKASNQTLKQLLERLFEHQRLSREEARDTLIQISNDQFELPQIAAFLTVFRMRSITVDELSGFREALLMLCRKIDLSDFNAIDLCGTGGDGKNTFNISTLASFVVAGAGEKVAKHGNYGVSSTCGSSNVMEHLGYRFTNTESDLQRQLDKAGICFLHAPLFHPAMAAVAPIRKGMGVRTFFNMLGPLVNPSAPANQLVGVFSLELARLYQYIFQDTGKSSYAIVHSLDGYDEVSLTGSFKVISNEGETVSSPADLGLPDCEATQLHGGETIEDAAGIFLKVLSGEGTDAQNNAVIANASLALKCLRPNDSQDDCVAAARESLLGQKAFGTFKELLKQSA